MKHRISPATVIASVALFFSLGGVGIAASGYRITSIWQIAPKVRHQLHGTQGRAGPQGLQGLLGPAGPRGATGPQGPAIDNFTVAEGNQVEIPPGGDAYSIAICPTRPGQFVWAVSGGYTSSFGVEVFYSTTLGLYWQVGASNPTSAPIKLQAWAVCLTGATNPG